MSPCQPMRMSAAAASAASVPSVSPYSSPTRTRHARLRTTSGVPALIEAACSHRERQALAEAFSPLFPDACPWATLADVGQSVDVHHSRIAVPLSKVAEAVESFRLGLTATAGRLARWLDAGEQEIRELALAFARRRLPGLGKLTWAQELLGGEIPGDSVESQMSRLNDARFWRRSIRTRLLREREHFYMRLGCIGKLAEAYVSEVQARTRSAQLKAQAQWLKETVLVPRSAAPGEFESSEDLLTLDKVATSARTRFAKTYTFVKAMEGLANDAGLVSAMVTMTAAPEWHPNPSHGQNSWNGESPAQAQKMLAQAWQTVLIEMHKKGVGLSGLRVVEPHQDGCPHWHAWVIYHPQSQGALLSALAHHFPGKLKLRAPSRRGQTTNSGDRMFDSREDVRSGVSRALAHPKEGARVEVSLIDPSISSGASYAMKYLLKTVDGGDDLNREVDLFGDADMNAADAEEAHAQTVAQAKRRKQQLAQAKRVDAWRAVWGVRSCALFGVSRCLTAWDQLRRLQKRPDDERMATLWALARGGDEEGRIEAGVGKRGDARGFLLALGGLAAARNPKAKPAVKQRLGRLTQDGINGYGDIIERTVGVTLIEARRVKSMKPGSKPGKVRTVIKTVSTVVAEVKTKLRDWCLAPQRIAAQALARSRMLFEQELHAPMGGASPVDLLGGAPPA